MEGESISLAEVLDSLRERKQANPEQFPTGATLDEIEEANARLTSPIPRMWQEVLQFSNGFYLDDIYFGWTTAIGPMEDDNRPSLIKRAPPGSLWIGNHGSGDVIVLDVARETQDGDCPVVWVAHDFDENDKGQPIPIFLLKRIEHDRLYDHTDEEDEEEEIIEDEDREEWL